MKVLLKDIVDRFEQISDGVRFYLNRSTGEVLLFTDYDHFEEVEEEEVLESDDYAQFPNQWDLHEYSIVEDFCERQEDEGFRERLLDAIRGRGAFRRFKGLVYQEGKQEEWSAFRTKAFEKLARNWLASNDLPFVEESEDD